MSKTVYLLWTGGWDSTFRLVELSFKDIDVFPIYVLDLNRKSKDIELKRMQSIIDVLRIKPMTKARIHDIEIILKDSISADAEITEAYNLIQRKTNLGSQHEWLARLAKNRPGMEMGTEAGDPETSHILKAIRDFGKLNIEDNVGYLDKELSSKEGLLVLGGVLFPIITRTEKDMVDQIHEWGYEDVMEKIWFCHTPIQGQACGCCHPCEVKIESEMEFLLTKKALLRYKVCKKVTSIFGVQIGNLLKRVIRKMGGIL